MFSDQDNSEESQWNTHSLCFFCNIIPLLTVLLCFWGVKCMNVSTEHMTLNFFFPSFLFMYMPRGEGGRVYWSLCILNYNLPLVTLLLVATKSGHYGPGKDEELDPVLYLWYGIGMLISGYGIIIFVINTVFMSYIIKVKSSQLTHRLMNTSRNSYRMSWNVGASG